MAKVPDDYAWFPEAEVLAELAADYGAGSWRGERARKFGVWPPFVKWANAVGYFAGMRVRPGERGEHGVWAPACMTAEALVAEYRAARWGR